LTNACSIFQKDPAIERRFFSDQLIVNEEGCWLYFRCRHRIIQLYIGNIVSLPKIDVQHQNNYGDGNSTSTRLAAPLPERNMDQTQIEKLRSVLIEACDEHLARGGTIVDGTFGRKTQRCPMGCVSGSNPNVYLALKRKIGFRFSSLDMLSFVNGFDNISFLDQTNPIYQLGQELRNKYITPKST
jgi:hypothetical protein